MTKEWNASHPGRKLAVITGASSAIGYELAKIFAKNNFDLFITAKDAAILDVANSLMQLGAKVEPTQVNLATFEGVEKL